jgi:hypothetical protein
MVCGKFCTRHNNVIRLATKYDVKKVIPFLMIVFHQVNPTIDAIITQCDELAL